MTVTVITPAKLLFLFSIFFIVGVVIQSLAKIPQSFLWGILFLAPISMAVFFFKNKTDFVLFGFCVLFLIFGILRFQLAEFNIAHNKLSQLNDKPEKITLTGIITAQPDARDRYQSLKIKVKDYDSFVLVKTNIYGKYSYLDEVEIYGTLKTPMNFDSFDYKKYLQKEGIYSVMDFPKVKIISVEHQYSPFSFLYEKVLKFKLLMTDSINRHFIWPQNFIMEGFIFGNDKNMPKDLKDKFNATGLSHLTAVSGSNIIIMFGIFLPCLLFFGFWRRQALWLSIVFIWLYILMIGLPVSAMRAGVMASAGILAQSFGRQSSGLRMLVFAAFLMLLQNPFLLFYDIAFQLSFLASLGIIVLNPFFNYLKSKLLKDRFAYFFDILAVTVSAQIFALPVIVYNFGVFSYASLVSNLLVLPFIPAVTILGFLAALVGLVSNFLGLLIAYPCWMFLEYFLAIIDIFYQPWLILSFAKFSVWWLIFYYVVIGAIIKFTNKKISFYY